MRKPKESADGLMRRLQGLVYEFHALGHFEEARPHILWLMELAEKAERKPPQLRPAFNS
ncbi:MAG TPA: hypothetical protein VGC36_00775 [Rhizomicrobium sp.]